MDQLDKYIEKASKSIFRYEGLQDYSAEDGEDFAKNYLKTKQLTFQPKDNEWWRDIKEKNGKGIKTCRVRLVTKLLTDYTQAELAHLEAAAAYSGEDIRIIKEDDMKDIWKDPKDYYLVDDKYLFLMDYGPKGKYLGSILVEGDEVKRYADIKNTLIEASTPIGT
jgi:hypothetical protein